MRLRVNQLLNDCACVHERVKKTHNAWLRLVAPKAKCRVIRVLLFRSCQVIRVLLCNSCQMMGGVAMLQLSED